MINADLVEQVAHAVGPRVTKRECGVAVWPRGTLAPPLNPQLAGAEMRKTHFPVSFSWYDSGISEGVDAMILFGFRPSVEPTRPSDMMRERVSGRSPSSTDCPQPDGHSARFPSLDKVR